MPAPRTAYDAVLHAARDVTKLGCALDAEMLGAALLGSVYAMAAEDRAEAVRDFVGRFLTATVHSGTPAAVTIRDVFATLVPEADGAGRVGHDRRSPSWAGQLGRVRATGCWAYGDVYGDQTSYLVTFAYEDAAAGGPEHAVVALVDHNIGITKDVFVSTSAETLLDQVRQICEADELTWFRSEDPGRLRDEVSRHLEVTDGLGDLPSDGSLATDRTLAGARLALLPAVTTPPLSEPSGPDDTGLIRDFLTSPEAARFDLPTGPAATPESASLEFCLSLLLDHGATLPGADPLRWSPAVAGLFLLDWVHRRAVLDLDDAAMLPRVVRAWSAFAMRRRGLPAAAAEQAEAALEELIPEFARLYTTGERRSPATAAVAQLIAEGVDPNDTAAIDAWLEANREE
ncbi:hypothetical protein FHR83_007387 [Actinoplanes campanulatus]|uniref:Uncharacterized protein n=1 Tax=Actinoplanes campanulatus TaxID=113559 RepID=A0A7W5ANS1_9ACTN|nr:hypothetical protein [Actinoplanes campanulatus]MBB3099678.1 hypothetical protein [Actinoplanes campanulatus]GGN25793.1 hypothetical protein GCM10010109_42300 [Actinoplanes campanulatus]GID41571.1 hypothetical protein Aca09nite_80770 [Actinoplanes campanulatus]